MELAFRVNSYEYLKELLFYISDKGYSWANGDELRDMEFAEWLWNFFDDSKELLIVLEKDGVYYDSTINKDDYNVLYCNTIEELDNTTYIILNLASTVLKKVNREYVIYAPDKLHLKGHSETSLLARNGDTYFVESVMVYGEHILFTKEEAEKAMKELNLNWGIAKVK